MDANELNALLEDVRECLDLVKVGDAGFLETLTKCATENKIAFKAIGHMIEQHLLKVTFGWFDRDFVLLCGKG
jgi:hypothetical protein